MNHLIRMPRISVWTVAALAIAAALSSAGQAQTIFNINFVPTTASNWNVVANWHDTVNNIDGIPDGTMFDDRGIIASGGTAFVQSPNPTPPGALVISNGAAEVRSGGTLTTVVSKNLLLDGSIFLNHGAGQTAMLTVLPGGTLNSAGPLLTATEAANLVVVGGTAAGTATVNVPAAALNGTTRVYPNAAFTSTGSVNFSGTSVYRPEINGASAASLSIGQNAILGGTLNANFTGAAPTVGAAWSLMQADAIQGGFATVTSSLTLPSNQRLMTRVVPIANQRQRLDLELAEVLVLNVNRDTGVVSITHPGTTTIPLDNYSIQSSQARVVSANWTSVSDQGALGGGWSEATAGTGGVSELRSTGNGSAVGGTNVSLGAIYNSLGGTFAANVNDLSFQYSDREGGRIVNGIVNYTGAKLNNLLLQVDPTTGRAVLRNTSTTTVPVEGYVISSTASLTPSTWNSLDDQNSAGGDWLELLNPSTGQIGEVKTLSSTTLAPRASYDLGMVFNPNPLTARDLTFEFLQAGQSVATVGAVVYEAIVAADFDNNSTIDGADLLRWQRGLGVNTGATNDQGDANLDAAVNGTDLTLWESRFGLPASVAAVTSVPEPGSAMVATILGSAVFAYERARGRARARGN